MESFERFQLHMERRQQAFDSLQTLARYRFEEDNGLVPQLQFARQYVSHWETMQDKNLGLLFWGQPGNGKTFAAACIANALIESQECPTVIMSNFGLILRQLLARQPAQREEYLDRLMTCDLLILDDLGMERQTDYSQEQVYGIIDGRYLARKPLIVTTNLTLTQLKKPYQAFSEEYNYQRKQKHEHSGFVDQYLQQQ